MSDTWKDRHPVELPGPCSLDHAYDGVSAETQRRELHPLERDILCRILSDITHQLRSHQDLNALTFTPGPGGIRLDVFEVAILQNVWEAINPRSENNW